MSVPPVFVTEEEAAQLRTVGRALPRSVRDNDPRTGGTGPAIPLVTLVEERVRQLIKRTPPFECLCIGVADDDGMSWSAEQVHTALREGHPRFERLCFSDRLTVDGLPALAQAIGEAPFLRYAARNKLTASFTTERALAWWFATLLAVVLVGYLALRSDAWLGSSTLRALRDWTGSLPVWGALAAIGGLFLKVFAPRLARHDLANAREKYRAQDALKNERFLDDLARALQTEPFPRILIVDNFERLDDVTRAVLGRYLSRFAEAGRGAELWIVFELRNGDALSQEALTKPERFGSRRTSILRQLSLEPAERLHLARLTGDPGRGAFLSVKNVCRPTVPRSSRYSTLIADYRSRQPRNPDRYDSLDFLALIGLTARHGRVLLPSRLLERHFSPKSGFLSELLRLPELLRGTLHRLDEVRRCHKEIVGDTTLSQFAQVEAGGLAPIPEAAWVLEASGPAMGFPNAPLGHLVWSVIWQSELEGVGASRSSWLRLLTHHLLEADASLINDSRLHDEAILRLLRGVELVLDRSVRGCILHRAADLLERAISLFECVAAWQEPDQHPGRSDPPRGTHPEAIAVVRRLVDVAWSAYCLVGDERVLAAILRLDGLVPRAEPPAVLPQADDLTELFWQTLPLAPEERRLLPERVNRLATTASSQRAESVLDFARSRAAWLALSLGQYLGPCRASLFHRAALLSREALFEVGARTRRRCEAGDASFGPTEVATLVSAVWCIAVSFTPAAVGLRLASRTKAPGAGGPGDAGPFLREEWHHYRRFASFLEDVVLLVLAMRDRRKAADTDYLSTVMTRELCLAALAAAALPSPFTRLTERLAADDALPERKKVRQALELCCELLEADLELANGPQEPAFLERLERLISVTGLIWSRFGFDRMAELTQLRRLQLGSHTGRLPAEDGVQLRHALDSISPAFRDTGYPFFLASVITADALSYSSELSAHFLHQFAHAVLSGRHSSDLKAEVAVTFVFGVGHFAGLDVKPILDELAGPERGGGVVSAHFASLLPAEYQGQMLRLWNAGRAAEREEELLGTLRSVVEPRLDETEFEDVRTGIGSLLDVLTLQSAADRGALPATDVLLSSWADRKQEWTYAWVLELILARGGVTPEVLEDCVEALHSRPDDHEFNSYLFLALAAAEALDDAPAPPDGRETAVRYLSAAIPRWRSTLPAETNIKAYHLLRMLDAPAKRPEYTRELTRWEVVRLQRDHLRLLPRLAREGCYFLVFRHYAGAMLPWGLAFDLEPRQAAAAVAAGAASARAIAAEWTAGARVVPQPILFGEAGPRVSTEFVRVGSALFALSGGRDPVPIELRREFDLRAQAHLPELLDLILLLELPASIKDLLARYKTELLEVSVPN